jgi:hypothetical protein
MSEPILPKKERVSGRNSARLDMNTPYIQRHAVDQLLLAVIDAYPDEDDLTSATWRARRLKRLQAAREALFAEDESMADPSDEEIAALQMMAIWHYRDTQLQAMRDRDPTYLPTANFDKPRSFRKLALEASIRIKGEERTDFIEKIRKEFASNQKAYMSLMKYGDDIELMREFNALQKALDGLAKVGIRFVRPKS